MKRSTYMLLAMIVIALLVLVAACTGLTNSSGVSTPPTTPGYRQRSHGWISHRHRDWHGYPRRRRCRYWRCYRRHCRQSAGETVWQHDPGSSDSGRRCSQGCPPCGHNQPQEFHRGQCGHSGGQCSRQNNVPMICGPVLRIACGTELGRHLLLVRTTQDVWALAAKQAPTKAVWRAIMEGRCTSPIPLTGDGGFSGWDFEVRTAHGVPWTCRVWGDVENQKWRCSWQKLSTITTTSI